MLAFGVEDDLGLAVLGLNQAMLELGVPKPMPRDGTLPLIRRRLPQLDGIVGAATRQEVPVGAEGDRVNIVRMPGEGLELFPGPRVPQLDGIVPTATCQDAPV